MFKRDPEKIGFSGVALFIIFAGIVVFSAGLVMWLFNYFGNTAFNFPASKIIGGLIVIALGYIVLELELLRKK